MAAPLRVSVLIPTFERPDELALCLAAIERQTRRPDQVLVIVREDDSRTPAVLAERPAEPVAVSAPGVVAALRQGLRSASGDIVAITDDDARPWPDWLERIEAHFARDERVGGVGGPDRLTDRPPAELDAATVVGKVWWFGRTVGNHHLGAGDARPVDVLKGANMSLRAAAVNEEWLDDKLRGEGAQVHWELSLCLGLRGEGWRLVFDPAAGVDHHPAERVGEERAALPERTALADEVHNETLALLRRLPAWRKPVALAYGLLVGTRRAPGLATFLERLPNEPDRRALARRLATSAAGRAAGLATWLRSR